VTLFLLIVFGLLLGAAIKGRMEKAGFRVDPAMAWDAGRKWWDVSLFALCLYYAFHLYLRDRLSFLAGRRMTGLPSHLDREGGTSMSLSWVSLESRIDISFVYFPFSLSNLLHRTYLHAFSTIAFVRYSIVDFLHWPRMGLCWLNRSLYFLGMVVNASSLPHS
jgi:hypothetical protein